jgi:uncharacterized protein (TIRG00374 family)
LSRLSTLKAALPWKRVLGAALAITVLIIVFGVVLPGFADYSEVWEQLTSMDPRYLLLLAAVEVLNLATYAPSFMTAMPGLRFRQALEVQFTGTALSNVAPLGGAVSLGFQFRMLREWGFTTGQSSRAVVVTGVFNNLCNLALPVVALTLLTLGGGRNAALTLAAEIGAAAFVVILTAFVLLLWSDAGARVIAQAAEAVLNSVRRIFRRPPRRTLAAAMVRFREDSTALLKQRWWLLTIWTLAGILSVFLVFIVCLRAVGIPGDQVTITEAFAAWSVTRLLSAIPITPGGLGIIDVGLAGALTGFGGDDAKVVAAVLLYRVVTFVPPIVLGLISLFTWKRHPHPAEVVSVGGNGAPLALETPDTVPES